MLRPLTVSAAGIGVSVGVGSGVFVAGKLVSVGGSSAFAVSVAVLVQAESKMPRTRIKAIKTRADLFCIPLIIPIFRTWHASEV